MQNKVIPIFYACDNAFVKFTMVSLRSMMENAAKDRKYQIHILHTDIEAATQQAVLRMQNEQFSVMFDDVTSYLQSISSQMPIRDYYSKTTYYRLFIAEMFPELNKAIYIDSDTVVQGDISEFFDFDIDHYDLGACHEQAMVQEDAYGTYVEKCLGIDRNSYFNAGILLINCRRFRQRKVLDAFVRLLGGYDFRVTQDEDYLNLICKDHVRFLPQSWNTEIFGIIENKKEDCNILHYIMTSKPWHYADCKWGDVFWKYAQKTKVYGEIKAILDAYTDEQRANDEESCRRLMALAIDETNRPDNYLNRLNAKRDPGRLAVMEKIKAFEREGIFDQDVEDDPPSRQLQPGEVDYLGKKLKSRLLFRFSHALARRFVYRMMDQKQLIIKDIVGLEHFSSLREGAVVTCNHFNAFDSFAIQMAYEYSEQRKRKKHFYRVIREGNYTSFPGFFGFLMRHHHTLPLASNRKVMKEFFHATDTLLKEGHFVLIYPEQSMWWNYRKPKPLKDGGFYFAAKNHVPVLPCFITMRDSDRIGGDGFPIQEYTIHISEPIYPKEGVSVSANTAWMLSENARVWREIYEREYGMPLQYDTVVKEERQDA
ncbi:MAG: 1-acyl-sn-glycerol-3-phosphate acyltransferase [Clostridia bacterium]|nr:1-acyl-sn-glycerol-3-phosphate acyltransferase [Clostridia bacterium]